MARTYGTVEEYVDEYPIPHRTLTNGEMYQLFTQINEVVREFYNPREIAMEEAVKQAKQALEEAKATLSQNPRSQQLREEWKALSTGSVLGPDAADRFRAVSDEMIRLETTVRNAEIALDDAENALWHLTRCEIPETLQVLSFLAGQRNGLRLGVRLAGKLAIHPAAEVGGIPGDKFALVLSVAMTDDGEADALIKSIATSETAAA